MDVYPRLASDVADVAVAGTDVRESTVLLLTAEDEDVVGRLVTDVAGFAVAAGFATSEEAVRDGSEDTVLAVVEEAGRDTADVFVRAALGVTVELLVEAGRGTAVDEVFREEAGATVEEEAGRDTDDGAEVLDDVLEDVAGGLLTEVEEVGLDVVCAFW